MPVLRARRINDETDLTVDFDRLLLVSTLGETQLQPRVAEFVALLLVSAPAIVTYKEIDRVILEPHGISRPPASNQGYIRKLKLQAERAFSAVLSGDGQIENIRSTGYRLSDEWDLLRTKSGSTNALHDLASQCVQLMEETELVSDGEGGLHLDAESRSDELSSQLREYDLLVVALLQEIRGSLGSTDAQVCAAFFREIRSYMAFGRVGRVESVTWRTLFRDELAALLAAVVRLIDQGT